MTHTDTLELIVDRCHRIENSRTQYSVLMHAMGELNELSDEIHFELTGYDPGPDGILGEAIDILLCAIDFEVMRSGITVEDIQRKIIQKLDKWERLYGKA